PPAAQWRPRQATAGKGSHRENGNDASMDLHPDGVLVAVLTTCRCAYWHFENIYLPHQYDGARAVNRPMRRIVLALLLAISAAPLFATDPIVLGPYLYD